MTATTVDTPGTAAGDGPRRRGGWLLRLAGWTLMGAGAVVLLYVVYVLFYTGVETQRAQSGLIEAWESEVGPIEVPETAGDPPEVADDEEEREPPDVGDAIAIIAFERPGSDEPPVTDDFLAIVEGVGYRELQDGPGRYPESGQPGEDGNFAVAGHRVTWAAPFHDLDELQEGDEIHVWDRSNRHFVYVVSHTEIVRPIDTWVVEDGPPGDGAATITLTTCHPRYSNRQRLIAFGELVS